MKFKFTLMHLGQGSLPGPITLPPLSSGVNIAGPYQDWTTGDHPTVSVTGSGILVPHRSNIWANNFDFTAGATYEIEPDIDYNFGLLGQIYFVLLDDDDAILFSEQINITTGSGTYNTIISFTAPNRAVKFGFYIEFLSVSGPETITVTVYDPIGELMDDPSYVPLTTQQIDEPDGWKEAVFKLARDKEFYSLVELFDGSFIFYGDNGEVNGGLRYIENLEQQFGLDASIEILIEIAPDDETYETCFEGQLDLSLGERLPKNKYRIPIIRDNFWAKFMSRLKTPVDLMSGADLDGKVVSNPVQPVDITLTDQKITYFSEYNEPLSITYDRDVGEEFLMLGWSNPIRNDIKVFNILREAVTPEIYSILGVFEAPWDGKYQLQIKFKTAIYVELPSPGWSGATLQTVFIKKTSPFTGTFLFELHADEYSTNFVTDGTDSWNEYDIDTEYTLARGEQLAIAIGEDTDWTVFGETQQSWPIVDLATTDSTIVLLGEQTIDGTLTSTSRVLVKNQGNPQENGIYVTGAGAWTRATDMDSADEFENVTVFVTGGTNQTDTAWRQTEIVNTMDVDAVRFQLSEPSDERFRVFPGYPLNNYIRITAVTTFPATKAQGFLIHDAAAAILQRYGLHN